MLWVATHRDSSPVRGVLGRDESRLRLLRAERGEGDADVRRLAGRASAAGGVRPVQSRLPRGGHRADRLRAGHRVEVGDQRAAPVAGKLKLSGDVLTAGPHPPSPVTDGGSRARRGHTATGRRKPAGSWNLKADLLGTRSWGGALLGGASGFGAVLLTLVQPQCRRKALVVWHGG